MPFRTTFQFRIGPIEILIFVVPLLIATSIALVVTRKQKENRENKEYGNALYEKLISKKENNESPTKNHQEEKELQPMSHSETRMSYIPNSVLDNPPILIKPELSKMPSEKQGLFVDEYRRKQKNTGIAYLLWFIIGLHYIYLNKLGWQFFYWITAGGFLIWAFIDLFRIPGMVRDYNKDVVVDVLRDIKILSS